MGRRPGTQSLARPSPEGPSHLQCHRHAVHGGGDSYRVVHLVRAQPGCQHDFLVRPHTHLTAVDGAYREAEELEVGLVGGHLATRAGLTERTFFRYFADKREVLFSRSAELRDLLVGALSSTPQSTPPLAAVANALAAATGVFQGRRESARQRQLLIAANAELQERELIKLASLAAAMADTLRRRAVRAPAASLAAEAGIAVFRTAFERWVNDAKQRNLSQHIRESLDELKAVATGQMGAGAEPVASRSASASRRAPAMASRRVRAPKGTPRGGSPG